MRTSIRKGLALSSCALALLGAATAASADTAIPRFRREIRITGKNLLIPVGEPTRGLPRGQKDPATLHCRLKILVDGKLLHAPTVSAPRKIEDAVFWGYLDVGEYVGRTAIVACDRPDREFILNAVRSSDEMGIYREPVYTERARPQFHFTPRQGWNNDPNGLYYHDGLYHISWQSNPLGRMWNNMYWGHAVSRDLVHWEESNEWPRTLRAFCGFRHHENRHAAIGNRQCFSGGGAVDVPNTLGLRKPGGPATILLAFTDTAIGESLAYSVDGGHRFNIMNDINPIIVHPNPNNPEDKKSWGRDPKIMWHAPSRKWIVIT